METTSTPNYTSLYDKGIRSKVVEVQRKEMTPKERKEFLAKLSKSEKMSNELLALLTEMYSVQAHRYIGDALVDINQTIKCIQNFKNSLQ